MNKELNLAKIFLIYSIIFGSILVFLVPSFQSPDENTHFLFAYNLSTGKVNTSVKNKKSGYNLPTDMINEIHEKEKMYNSRDKKYSYEKMYFDQLLSANMNEKKFFGMSMAPVSTVAYIIPSLGIQITDYVGAFSGDHVKTAVMLQFARFLSLLIYSIIGYFAIKITPKFKKTFFVVLLLPLSLFLRSMVTYDSFILVITALSIALMLRLIDDKSIQFDKKYLIIFTILGYILFNVKIVYSISLFGLLIVDSKQFGGKREKIKKFIIIGSLVLFLTYIKKTFIINYNVGGDSEITAKQIKFILNNPISYMGILFKNIFGQMKQQNYWMVGTLGNLDTYMPYLFVFIMNLYLIVTFILESFYEKVMLPLWTKICYVILVILVIMGMYTLMYMSWTPQVLNKIGGDEITGVQGRYFIPLLLLIPLIFSNNLIEKLDQNGRVKKILDKIKLIYDYNFHYVTLCSLIMMTIIIFMRYYV